MNKTQYMSSENIDGVRNSLAKLGFTTKEADLYLALLELGTQPASVLARRTSIPKPTVHFLFEGLTEKGYIQRSKKGRIFYFYAEAAQLQAVITARLSKEKNTLTTLIPLLQELQSPYSAPPKVTFLEGVEACREGYAGLLQSQEEILEFGVHRDLVARFGEAFMREFIAGRVREHIFLRALVHVDEVEKTLQKVDREELRCIRFLPEGFGELYSSIAIQGDAVLLLNLQQDAFGIRLQSAQIVQSLRTIFESLWYFTQ